MATISNTTLTNYVGTNIKDYHDRLFEKLTELKLKDVLKRKNPYLFKAKSLETAYDLVKSIVDAYLSSQEETKFGDFLERLAVMVCGHVYSGQKSSSEGIDLDFLRDGKRYIVSIKSGPNWGNSSQIAKLKDHFKKAKRILGTNASKVNVIAVNGCCYGKSKSSDKGEYLKLCGQQFWELVSGEEDFYTRIIEPLGHEAKERNEAFNTEYSNVLNKFTLEFSQEYCAKNGAIDWDKLVKFNSGSPS